ncbi:MAG: hypothetical protein ACJ704_03135, partial [Nitrososphaeraceae archaeon]
LGNLLFCLPFYYPPPSTSNGDLPVALETAGCGLVVIIFPDGLDNDGADDGGEGGELAVRLVGLCTVLFAVEYVTEHLPQQYEVCLTALESIIKRAFNILETWPDNREKLQGMELFKDTHLVKLELLSNATIIDSALQYIRSKQQEQHKRLVLDTMDNDNHSYDNLQDNQPTTIT